MHFWLFALVLFVYPALANTPDKCHSRAKALTDKLCVMPEGGSLLELPPGQDAALRNGMLVKLSDGTSVFLYSRYLAGEAHRSLREELLFRLQEINQGRKPRLKYTILWAGEFEVARRGDGFAISRMNDTSGMLSETGKRSAPFEEVLNELRKILGPSWVKGTKTYSFTPEAPHLDPELNAFSKYQKERGETQTNFRHGMLNILQGLVGQAYAVAEGSYAKRPEQLRQLRERAKGLAPFIKLYFEKLSKDQPVNVEIAPLLEKVTASLHQGKLDKAVHDGLVKLTELTSAARATDGKVEIIK